MAFSHQQRMDVHIFILRLRIAGVGLMGLCGLGLGIDVYEVCFKMTGERA